MSTLSVLPSRIPLPKSRENKHPYDTSQLQYNETASNNLLLHLRQPHLSHSQFWRCFYVGSGLIALIISNNASFLMTHYNCRPTTCPASTSISSMKLYIRHTKSNIYYAYTATTVATINEFTGSGFMSTAKLKTVALRNSVRSAKTCKRLRTA